MTRPDLSLLFAAALAEDAQRSSAGASPPATATPPTPAMQERPGADRPHGAVAALIAELRASQAELESQNQMLRYSQAVAERASERFETLFASVPLALMVVDAHDIVVQANAMAHLSFQPSERDRPLTMLQPFVHPADLARVQQAFAQASELGHSEVKEVVFTIEGHPCITGDLHIARIEAAQEDEDTPAPVQFLCAVIDQGPLLAERRALQERNAQLHASEKRLAAVIDSALDAILCVDQEQRITVFNPTAAALFQCNADDALGSPLERFLPGAAQALAFSQLTTQAMLGEMTARTASGKELAVEVSISFERHATNETATVFARDLTGRKKAEAQRNELEAQLRESHKMQAVGTMAGGIAHDFNNILGAILGNVELAKADCAAAPDTPVSQTLRESLEEIDKAARRARDLVRQILTFSRNEPPQRAAVSLAEVAHDTERLLRVTLPPTIALHLQVSEQLPAVLGDATQIGQAVLNLCTNAVQALGSSRRGHVHVEAQRVQPEQRLRERLGLAAHTDYIALTVRDDGPGMDAATQARIFEPFFTTKPVGQGTGLGLAVVHGIMRTHGGSIAVQSSPGQGSCFTLYFPVADSAAAGVAGAGADNAAGGAAAASATSVAALPAPTPARAASTAARGHHVMYVDDDQALVFVVQRLLRRRGYEVSTFTDPQAALQALRAAPEKYDLLVTDYNMPGFSGVELLRATRQIRPALPVALASGYVSSEIEQAALAEGARALIHKPNDVQEFCATVARLLEAAH
ncbi:PAS domain-containing hybrid sensor histidine kinase/response regulator [Extensimonas vulgaris]|uniref:histidine kinase n=1 Tax=Extensimonas vulgaris TaxID=1031594 RepID=A0A369AVJ7_9BURK|nr:PAS domain S-box-containing protein [Extensimonas vulgaris]TWI40381.1 PAS domain S-box-containing protein [Extensimonas vulgaris]TXD16407.1 response regulator [Extensimonas vulgaris]